MALIKKTVATSSAPVRKPKEKLELALVTEPSAPPQELRSYTVLLYGDKGIGKTSLSAQFPGAYFLCTEPGTKALRVKASQVPDWDHFVGYIDLIEKDADPERTVIVDVIDLAYEFKYNEICRSLGIDNPTEEKDFGATWRKIRREFREEIERLTRLPGGVIFLSHDTEREITMSDGTTVDRRMPTMAKQASQEVCGLVDIIVYYGWEKENRFLNIVGSQELVAKCRCEENFFVKNHVGEADYRVKRIAAGNSSKIAYDNLCKAFNNQQDSVDGLPPGSKKVVAAPVKKPIVLRK